MSNTNENAKPQYRLFEIPGYPDYYADITGAIWSTKRGAPHKLAPKITVKGYAEVCLSIDEKRLYRYVHALILLTFHGPRPEGFVACHGPDPDKLRNEPNNLRWGSSASNMADFIAAGGWNGRKKGGTKLNPRKVRAIRKAAAAGASSYTLAPMYGVDHETIRKVVLRKSWKNVI